MASLKSRLHLYTVLAAGDRDALRHAIALSGLIHLASSFSFDESYTNFALCSNLPNLRRRFQGRGFHLLLFLSLNPNTIR